ncbi:MAG: GNAT family N-acetyltransferase [Promethearchaeota archaeon]
MSELYQIKQLNEDQIEDASKVLARAFQDDPLFIYCIPDPIERETKIATHCEWLILLGILSGEVYITSNDIEGVIIWHPHGIKEYIINKPSKEIKQRMRKVRRELFSDALYTERMSIFEEIANSFQIKYVNFPHWYLAFIGVNPIHQGMGYGSELIKIKLAYIDEQNLPCYLHTENEKNVKFYEHFGFELFGKNKIPNFDFYHHAMLRNKKKKV